MWYFLFIIFVWICFSGESVSVLISFFCIGIAAIVLHELYFGEKKRKKKTEEINVALNKLFIPDYIFYGDNDVGLALNGKVRKISFWSFQDNECKVVSYEFIKIVDFRIKKDEIEIARTQNDTALGRAIVGGVLFGGAGAIVGAVSADKQSATSKKIRNLSVEIVIDDIENPIKEIVLYKKQLEGKADDKLLDDASNNLELMIILLEISVTGVEFQAGMDLANLKNLMRLYEAKSKNIESLQEKKNLLRSLVNSRAVDSMPAVVSPNEGERLRSQFMLIERNMASIDNYMDVAKILGGSVKSNGFLMSKHYIVELDGVEIRIDNFESLRQWFLDNAASRVNA